MIFSVFETTNVKHNNERRGVGKGLSLDACSDLPGCRSGDSGDDASMHSTRDFNAVDAGAAGGLFAFDASD